ncbi:ATP-dependent DNA helicase PIF1-like [Rhipicephalus sanguineus]|uniref:ATP-dependent DNA helicase PIF1-like n=1 Tax=Rhipicephalus sanguineus TaxID=34632 RepID=UPI0020C266BE|nr:ATP-dependent DNA helicase PIF1-like [Rhipicephalus sanguineus]
MEVDAPSTSSSALAPVTSSYNAYVICASTGKAAVAVCGTTIHTAFKLVRSASTAGKQAALIGIMGDGGLSPSDLNTFRVPFRRVKCVIIDEVSMMSADQLRAVDCRLRQITQCVNELFGGLDVILSGDLCQLPPVLATEIYKRCRSADGLTGLTVVTCHHLEYFPLVRVVRQSNIGFSNVLTKIGDGRALEPDEVRLLESRFVTAAEAFTEAREHAPSAVRIFYSNNEVTRFNEAVEQAQGDGGYRTLRAPDEFLGCKTPHLLENAKRRVERMVSREFANLPREVLVVIGKPYMITSNIYVVDGLVNGAVGVLRMCEFEQGGEEEEQGRGGERRKGVSG